MTFAGMPLNEAEQKLVDAAQKGDICDLRTGDEEADKPANGASWGEQRTIRAEVIRRLCVGAYPGVKVDYRGIRLWGARITGELALNEASIDFPLWLELCHLTDPAFLMNTQIKSLPIINSYVPAVLGSRLEFEGDVTFSGAKMAGISTEEMGHFAVVLEGATVGGVLALDDGFEAGAEVRLTATRVGATLMCNGGSFTSGGVGRWALNADGVHAGQGISMGFGFAAQGDVNLKRAQVVGFLNFAGGNFVGGIRGNALTCDGVRVAGDVFLIDDFKASGEVRLVGANIDGDLNCRGGSFLNNEGDADALTADGVRVGGDVYLSHGFEALGQVPFVGAKLDGQMVCSGGKFSSKRIAAISLQGTSIGDALFWNDLNGRPEGHVNLRMASTRTLIDDSDSWPTGDDALLLEGFHFEQFGGASPLDVQTRLKWLETMHQERNDVGFKPQPYEQLAAVYDRTGHDQEAREVRIAKRKAERKYGGLSFWRRRQNRFLDLTIAYGWKPWRAIWIGLAIVALGFGLFVWAESEGGIRPADAEQWNLAQAVFYSLDTFLPIVDLGPEGDFEPNLPAGQWGWIAQGYLWFHILAGWLVTSLGVLAFSGLVRQK